MLEGLSSVSSDPASLPSFGGDRLHGSLSRRLCSWRDGDSITLGSCYENYWLLFHACDNFANPRLMRA